MAPRKPEAIVDEMFLKRWSPRAMSNEEVSDEELMSLFEAAKWAPSSNNNQPWRFVYAKRNSQYWDTFVGFLNEGNRIWAKRAAVLIVTVSNTLFDFDHKFSRTHSFDCGASWMSLAFQGAIMGLVVHAMQGFNYEDATQKLHVPFGFQVEAMIAVGKPGKKDDLPKALQKREYPSERKTLKEIAFEGKFKRQ
ncbi:MAG: nitroreductase family protein [bacterium]